LSSRTPIFELSRIPNILNISIFNNLNQNRGEILSKLI
jgi:hypothetical protein